ncbi:MAG: hypothetical protein QM817_40625 [Archangium sp.]
MNDGLGHRWLAPPLARNLAGAVELLLCAVGAACCSAFLISLEAPHVMATIALFVAGLRAISGLVRSRWALLAAGVLFVHSFFTLYAIVGFGLLLGWSTPIWLRVMTPLLVALSLWSRGRPILGVRVPLLFALGPWFAVCLSGWREQESELRCSDLHAVQAQPGVQVFLPTFTDSACSGGEVFFVDRYPRRVWESPDSSRFVVTTQGHPEWTHAGIRKPSPFTGSICDVTPGSAPRCFAEGTAQAIRESPAENRLYIAAYQQHRWPFRGVVYALSSNDAMQVEAERWMKDSSSGELFFDPKNDLLGVGSDEGAQIDLLRASDLSVLEPGKARVVPGETRFDVATGEGVFCFSPGPLYQEEGHAFSSLAFTSSPFRARLLGDSDVAPLSWLTLTWGCDWDPPSRRVFTSVANLGLLGTIDYDSGRYLSTHFVGFGVRAVTWDSRRRVVYLADFLRGDVFVVDPETGHESARWFVGRFVRSVTLSRDGSALFATSTAGVVRITLPPSRAQ